MDRDLLTRSNLAVLTLLGLRNIGPQAVDRLVSRFQTVGAVHEAGDRDLDGFPAHARASLRDSGAWDAAYDRAIGVVAAAEARDIQIISAWQDGYPSALREIQDRPPVIYLRGELRDSVRNVACIGTREPSLFGVEVTKRIVSVLVERGWGIISGLALGVDALAHEAALVGRGYTVAILANGLDAVYPKKNEALAERILSSGGAVLSEQPVGVPAIARHLVQRDRLQSGMSVATIVMQTDIKGGSMHTVRYTLTQGRLLVTPVPTGKHRAEPKSQGIVGLATLTGPELAHKLAAEGDYARLLNTEFVDRPVALALGGKADYEKMFAQLEAALVLPPRRPPQLGMF